MDDFSVKLEHWEILRDILKRVGSQEFMVAVAQSVYAEANAIMLEAKRQVPLQDGPLRASGGVDVPVIDGPGWSITLGFGGPTIKYALVQHENLTFHHPGLNSPRVGQTGRKAKYLEDPVRDRVAVMDKNLSIRIEAMFASPMGGQ